jgi:transitional endoplasmic reticulum ATPase
VGNFAHAYRLKLLAAKDTLLCYEHTKNAIWIKLAKNLLHEARNMKKKIKVKRFTEAPISTENGKDMLKNLEQYFIVKPRVNINDIGGLERSKRTLLEALEWPLKYQELMEEYGLDHVLSGVLLYGPPGCGKTMLVEGVANYTGAKLLEVNPAEITSKWFGESEKIVKRLFEVGRENRPCIIFIDEIDKILPRSTSSSVIPRITSVFLTEMDGLGTHGENQMVIVMASNEPWKIKSAVIRPGRCDRIIYVPPPDKECRKAIFRIHSESKKLAENVDFDSLAELTAPRGGWHYSGSDIANICRTAKKDSMRRAIRGEVDPSVDMSCFIQALKTVPPSISPEVLRKHENWAKRYASYIDS